MVKANIGRPRSEKSREAILNAAHDLLHEQGGTGLTIEAIARRAEVGKPTIYRWWPTLADIVLEALLRQANSEITVSASEPLQETLGQFLRQSMKVIEDGAGLHLRFLMAQAQQDEGFRERFRTHFTAKRRAVLRAIFLRAVEQGDISARQDLDMLVDIVFGTMWYRLLTGHAPMDESFADELTEMTIRLSRTTPAQQDAVP
ncbi:TetR/AcrR family transcriptional regulator [Desulfovibrio ferrophilus]|uniref:Regulatory protein TetR n=1 Tax=Desulfovibrio ferrophilus TaxID=241368 RepID=A0A2Z6AZH8_9BACT|nr:TetR/AcrR family transcriptional regulator [Desulfovibrio ferrophilus]BBD08556.1 regulatory protein TetR [Desulfovibrio ferrophilus]